MATVRVCNLCCVYLEIHVSRRLYICQRLKSPVRGSVDAICSSSRLFCTVIGEKGEVCRWGGEEFLFVFPGMDMEEVQLLMSDLLDDIRHTPVLYERKLIHVTMTFGVEEFGRNHTMESVIQEADRKLYLGKESGRNRVIY